MQTGVCNAVTCGNLPVTAGLRAYSAYAGFSCRYTPVSRSPLPRSEPNVFRSPRRLVPRSAPGRSQLAPRPAGQETPRRTTARKPKTATPADLAAYFPRLPGVAPPQVAKWAGHSVDVLLRVYAKCIHGQQDQAKRRILEATQPDQPSEQPPAGCPDDNPDRE